MPGLVCSEQERSPLKPDWVTLSVLFFSPVFKGLLTRGECKNTYPMGSPQLLMIQGHALLERSAMLDGVLAS